MLKKEDLESWNSIFTNCTISERDLANPGEQFLTKVLVAYLRKLGYKVEYVEMGLEERRLFAIKLVQQIDHILKITHKSYAFTYYDLISPTKKKTSTMLSILLNYLHYYEMYKMDILPKTTERITTWQKLQESNKKMQLEIKQNEVDAIMIKEDVAKLKAQLAKLEVEVEKQQAIRVQREQEFKENKQRLKQLEDKQKTLNGQKRHLKSQLVPNKEVYELQEQNKNFLLSVEDVKQAIVRTEQQIKATNELMRKIQVVMEPLNKGKNNVSPKLLAALRDTSQKLKNKQMEVSRSEKNKMELLQQIEQYAKDIKANEQKLKHKREQFDEHILQETSNIEITKKDLQNKTKKLSVAKEVAKSLEGKLREEELITEFLENSMKHLIFIK